MASLLYSLLCCAVKPISMFELKHLSLVVLVAQNTALVLTMRYSRTIEGPKYLTSTAVTIAELIKIVVCLAILTYNNGLSPTLTIIQNEIIQKLYELVKVSVPAILYTIQNNLLYVALSHLDAATYQVPGTFHFVCMEPIFVYKFVCFTCVCMCMCVCCVYVCVAVCVGDLPAEDTHDRTVFCVHA